MKLGQLQAAETALPRFQVSAACGNENQAALSFQIGQIGDLRIVRMQNRTDPREKRDVVLSFQDDQHRLLFLPTDCGRIHWQSRVRIRRDLSSRRLLFEAGTVGCRRSKQRRLRSGKLRDQ